VIWVEKGAEWDREMICDREDLSNFNHWLKELFEYWNCQRPANDNLLSQDDIDAISLFLRPSFELVQPLFDHVKQVRLSQPKSHLEKLQHSQSVFLFHVYQQAFLF
jgi:hypothetical protein